MTGTMKRPFDFLFAQESNPFLEAEPIAQGTGPAVRRGGRGIPHSPEFKQCVSQTYKACADKYGLSTLTKCLMDGTKDLAECEKIYKEYSDCLSDSFKECLDKFGW